MQNDQKKKESNWQINDPHNRRHSIKRSLVNTVSANFANNSIYFNRNEAICTDYNTPKKKYQINGQFVREKEIKNRLHHPTGEEKKTLQIFFFVFCFICLLIAVEYKTNCIRRCNTREHEKELLFQKIHSIVYENEITTTTTK